MTDRKFNINIIIKKPNEDYGEHLRIDIDLPVSPSNEDYKKLRVAVDNLIDIIESYLPEPAPKTKATK